MRDGGGTRRVREVLRLFPALFIEVAFAPDQKPQNWINRVASPEDRQKHTAL
jgi:hypothetical protein